MSATATGPGPGMPLRTVDDVRLMMRIRHLELALLRLFGEGAVPGTTHTCLGQEYVPVAVSGVLEERDAVFSNHRGHGHYIARFQDVEGLLAEILGRRGAICGGVGGSQHLMRDRFWSSGVQGQSLPVATGVALHLSRTEPGAVACVYMGDGTWGEGAVYEALNMAALWRLPLVVVVENNGIAQTTPTSGHLAGTIAGRAQAFGVPHVLCTSRDVGTLRDQIRPTVDGVRAGAGPLVLEFVTTRVGPHSKGDDVRPDDERSRAHAADWYARLLDEDPRWRTLAAAEERDMAALVAEVMARPAARGAAS